MKTIQTLHDHVFASFYHVEMQPSKQGIRYTVHAKLKHRILPTVPRITWMIRFKRVNGKIK